MTSAFAPPWANSDKRRCKWRAQCLRNAEILMGINNHRGQTYPYRIFR
jgi:hypothetical protein